MILGSDASPQSSYLAPLRGGLDIMRPQSGGFFNRAGALTVTLWSRAVEVSDRVSARSGRPCTHLPWLQV